VVMTGPSDDRFGVVVTLAGADVGSFELSAIELPGVPKIDAVKGETTREGILRALGVPSTLL